MMTTSDAKWEMEQALFQSCHDGIEAPTTIFILGAPRTGSTYLYQLVIRLFGLPFISNLTNAYFPTTPIVGLALQHGIDVDITYKSRYGKTDGPFQPSEGSGPMIHWFGGGHPSQAVSRTFLDGRSAHFLNSLTVCEVLYGGRPLVIKNAWNCFRVDCIAAALPKARFVWIRRDIREAAGSDLEARLKTKGSLSAWNSATPANVEALVARPPHEQVVENQYEFSRAIQRSFETLSTDRWTELWYEDLLRDPRVVIDTVGAWLGRESEGEVPDRRTAGMRKTTLPVEAEAIAEYALRESGRLAPFCHGGEVS